MNKTPLSVMVLSIIGIVSAVFNTCGVLAALTTALVPLNFGPPNPGMEMIQHDPLIRGVTLGGACVGSVLTVLLLAGSINSLKLRPVGRRLMLTFAWIMIAWMAISLVLNIVWVTPKMVGSYPVGSAERIGAIVGIAFSFFGYALNICFAVFIVVYFNRSRVRDAFNGIFPAEATNFPVEPGQGTPPPDAGSANSAGQFP